MALITTFMAGPLLKVFDPDNSLARAGASPVPDGGMGGDAAQPIPAAPTT
jgi:hypothetical protein